MKQVNFYSISLLLFLALPYKLVAQNNDQEIINDLEFIENIDLLEQMNLEMNQEEMPQVRNDDDFVDAPKKVKKNSENFSEENQ